MSGRKTALLFLSLSVPSFSQTVSVTYRLDSSWQTGLQAALQITNQGAAPLTNWTLSFDYAPQISSIWDARIISRSGNRYTIGPASWNPTIPPGATAYIGWVAQHTGSVTGPSKCLVSNQPVNSTTCPSGGGTTPALDTTPPSVPTGLRGTGQTTTSISIAWNASTDNAAVAGYEVRRSGVLVGQVTSTSAQITGLAAGTSYQFTVLAYDASGNKSASSSPVTLSTSSAPATCSTLPTTPTGLAVQTKSSSSATLAWNPSAAQANCSVTYSLLRGGVAIANGLTATTYTDSGLQLAASYTYTLVARNQFGSSQSTSPVVVVTDGVTPPPPSGGGSWPSGFFAPYVDMLLWPTPVLTDISIATGVKRFSLAFIVSGGGCAASWGGLIPLSQQFAVTDINNLRSRGGDVIVSFGGANGTELGLACTSVSGLQGQYQAAIDMYNLTRVDFDIEGWALADPASIDRRNKAIAGLQAAARARGKQLTVQFTLPVLPTGLTWNGIELLRNALQNGVDIGLVNIMAMDYGNAAADPYRMGEAAIAAVSSTFTQLKSLYGSSRTDAQLRAMQGVTPMIGLNDVVPEVFTLTADAPLLLQSATNSRIGMLSMWSLGRDKQCPGTPSVSPTCSGVPQSNYGFSLLFNVFQRP